MLNTFKNINDPNNKYSFFILALIAFLYYFFISHFPTSIHSDAWIDDAFGTNVALSILKGDWLGEYNNYTLAKGPGFSFFILICFFLGISVMQGIALLNIISVYLLARAFQRIQINYVIIMLIFVLLLFHPAIIPTRPMRDFICPSLLYIFISAIINILYIDKKTFTTKYILYGILIGLMLTVRDDWQWLIPVLVILAYIVLRYKKSLKVNIKNLLYLCVSPFIFLFIIALINFFNYGKLIINDFKETNYIRALNLIDRVDDGDYKPFLMSSSKKRQLIANNSPAFNEIVNYFDNEGEGWKIHGCNFYHWTCGDISTGWFFWGLRDAVALKGYYSSPSNASEFYKKLGDEIDESCSSNKLKCRKKYLPIFPYFSIEHFISHSKESIPTLFEVVSMFDHRLDIKPTPSSGGKKRFEKFVKVNGNPYFVPRLDSLEFSLSGWVVTFREKFESVEIFCKSDLQDNFYKPLMLNSPDVANYFKDYTYNKNRFKIRFKDDNSCELRVNNKFQIPLQVFNEKNLYYKDKDLEIHFDKFDTNLSKNEYEKNFYKLREMLASFFSIFIPIVFIIGSFIFLVRTFLGFFSNNNCLANPIYVVTLISFALLSSRLLMLFLVDLTMFPAINSLYLSCAYALVVLCGLLPFNFLFTKVLKNQ